MNELTAQAAEHGQKLPSIVLILIAIVAFGMFGWVAFTLFKFLKSLLGFSNKKEVTQSLE